MNRITWSWNLKKENKLFKIYSKNLQTLKTKESLKRVQENLFENSETSRMFERSIKSQIYELMRLKIK